ncbi:alpha/beta fold hydrolase [Rhizorhabdus argentea]|uniref:alpha/beta fold hydrolase n=1 Tax=Rhizorhabdus argentea TaxID=1387174 RepID=UPI0030EC3F1F
MSSNDGTASPSTSRALWIGLATGAAALSAAALYSSGRARRAERETPAIGSFVTVDDVRLHYIEAGSGPPLVLLHGNGATVQDFLLSGIFDAAAQNYRVIAFDRPGFGYSERPRSKVWSAEAQADLLHKAIGMLGASQPILLGHSWGTMVAVAMALAHPGAVSALVLLSGYYFATPRADVLLFGPPALPVAGDVLRYTLSPLAGRALAPTLFKAVFSPREVPDVMAHWPLGLALRPSQIRAAAADAALMVPGALSISERYGELGLPTVILAGDGDKIANFDRHSAALHDAVPGSELITVKGAGHMVHYAEPDTVLAAIDRAHQLATTTAPAGEEVIAAASPSF